MFPSCNSCHPFLFPFSFYFYCIFFFRVFFLSKQYLMKAKRLVTLSALGSALVTRVPIDRCRSPSSHFRTPLHLLATAILMRRSPAPLVSSYFILSVWCPAYSFHFYLYLSCKVKNVILNLFPRSFKTCIRAYVFTIYACALVYVLL